MFPVSDNPSHHAENFLRGDFFPCIFHIYMVLCSLIWKKAKNGLSKITGIFFSEGGMVQAAWNAIEGFLPGAAA